MATKEPLSCFCARKPLLAFYGIDDRGRVFVHVKVYKQNRIYGETLHYDGEIHIRCRECFRWHRVIFTKQSGAFLREDDTPESVLGRTVTGV